MSDKNVCPICKTNKDGKTVLIPILNTHIENNIEARQVHLECLDLWLDEELGIIFHKGKVKK
jgi:hypothetical protein